MNFRGYQKVEMLGNTYITRGPGLTLMGKIEDVLVSNIIHNSCKHLVIIDLIKTQCDETLGESLVLYNDHWKSSNPAITKGEKEATLKVMLLIYEELERRGFHFD